MTSPEAWTTEQSPKLATGAILCARTPEKGYTPEIGDRVIVSVPSWIMRDKRTFAGRIVEIDDEGRVRLNTSPGIFHPKFVDIRPGNAHRADVEVDPLEGLDLDPIASAHAAAFTHDFYKWIHPQGKHS